jgi:hypothetical protein
MKFVNEVEGDFLWGPDKLKYVRVASSFDPFYKAIDIRKTNIVSTCIYVTRNCQLALTF